MNSIPLIGFIGAKVEAVPKLPHARRIRATSGHQGAAEGLHTACSQ